MEYVVMIMSIDYDYKCWKYAQQVKMDLIYDTYLGAEIKIIYQNSNFCGFWHIAKSEQSDCRIYAQ